MRVRTNSAVTYLREAPDAVAGADVVVVVPDVHGDLGKAKGCLRSAGVVDGDGVWVGGGAVVVQLGDQVDGLPRGGAGHRHECGEGLRRDLEVLSYFNGLHRQARESGGAVYSLLGNHEMMNAMGWTAYADTCPMCDGERVMAFRPGGAVATMLGATRAASLRVGRLLFVHAGLLPKHLDACGDDLSVINDLVADSLTGAGDSWARDACMGEDGMLTTRAFWEPGRLSDETVEEVLRRAGADHMIVGHNARKNAVVPMYGGRVVVCDPGVSRAIYDAPAQALVVRRDGDRHLFHVARGG